MKLNCLPCYYLVLGRVLTYLKLSKAKTVDKICTNDHFCVALDGNNSSINNNV